MLKQSKVREMHIKSLVRMLSLRDLETEEHTRRVANVALDLARSMKVPRHHWAHIYHGAMLHDIGKIGIPDSILHKKGPLVSEEWITMKMHPVYAYELLRPIPYFRPALEIPYCHHEKWDGTGYPGGLKGEQIPFVARLFSVVDVWDALSSDRLYRPAYTKEHVIEYLQDQSGKHFDPHIVDAFLNKFDDFQPGGPDTQSPKAKYAAASPGRRKQAGTVDMKGLLSANTWMNRIVVLHP